MTGAEKIQGKKLSRIMAQLERERIMLSMRLVGKDYERLTMVTRIPKNSSASFFVIDPPRDFEHAVSKLQKLEIQFRFNGPDHLEYIFTTFGGERFDNETRINFPDYIERLQRRRYFRLSVPASTKVFFESDQVQREINLINISLRGTLGLLKTFDEKDQKKPVFKKEDYLKNLQIVFPSDTKTTEQEIRVNKAIIRRAEHDLQKNMDLYAIEFVSMDREEEKLLTKIIYNLQRSLLQKK